MYLHERDNWTTFFWDEHRIGTMLSDVRFAQGVLLGRISDLGFSIDTDLAVSTLTDEITASSRIEGIQLDEHEVRSSVARNLGLEELSATLDTHNVDGSVSILIDATQFFDAPITFDRLANWHQALFPTGYSGLRPITVGNYRTSPMHVVSGAIGHERIHYSAPEADRVAALMDEFFSWANSADLDPILLAGVAHLWFLTIHPYDDGNGRMARALSELFLARSDGSQRRFYSMARFILEHREQYYCILERSQKGNGDITEWLVWFIEALHSSIDRSGETVDEVIRRDMWWRSVDGIQLNQRQRKILKRLLDGFAGKLTTGKWAKICKVSTDTALRDINDLIAKGILSRSVNAGGRSTSYILRARKA